MNGSYSKVTISKEVVEDLKLICKTARDFCIYNYTFDYQKTVEVSSYIFFKKEVSVVDFDATEMAARDNHCKIIWSGYGSHGYFDVADYVQQYEDIIALSTGDECYFDAEILKALSSYMKSK